VIMLRIVDWDDKEMIPLASLEILISVTKSKITLMNGAGTLNLVSNHRFELNSCWTQIVTEMSHCRSR
jgi:hypothetical protein